MLGVVSLLIFKMIGLGRAIAQYILDHTTHSYTVTFWKSHFCQIIIVNKLTVFLQKYCMVAFVALILLKGCNVGLKAITASNKQSQILEIAEETFGDDPPEELLAFRDDGHLDNQESYSKLLNELEKECFEGRKEIAILALTSSEKYRQAEFDYSVLEVLDDYLMIAQSTNDIDSCKTIFASVSEEYK